jgi:hypothetical protein
MIDVLIWLIGGTVALFLLWPLWGWIDDLLRRKV